jgi:hypothetical protein
MQVRLFNLFIKYSDIPQCMGMTSSKDTNNCPASINRL